MPHAHILICFEDADKPTTKEKVSFQISSNTFHVLQYDRLVQAELPVVPDLDDPNYESIARLRELVEKHMVWHCSFKQIQMLDPHSLRGQSHRVLSKGAETKVSSLHEALPIRLLGSEFVFPFSFF